MNCLALMLAWTALEPPADNDIRALYEAGQLRQVVAICEQAILADPADRAAQHYLGRALVDLEYNLQTREAIDHLEVSMRGLPADHWMLGWSHVYIGHAYRMGGQPQQAIDRYELALALDVDPECAAAASTALLELGRGALQPLVEELTALYDGKRYAAVIRKAEAALRSDPRGGTVSRVLDPAFYHYLGRARVDLDDPRQIDKAIQDLHRALDLADDRSGLVVWNHFYLGMAHERAGRLEDARRHYDRVLINDVDPECATRARFRLLHLGKTPYKDWGEYASAYVVLHYPPDLPLGRNPGPYARTLDRSCSTISRELAVDPTRRVDVYVYKDPEQGRHMLGRELAWCDGVRQAVHVHADMDAGRVLVECLSHRIAPLPYCDSLVMRTGLAEALGGEPDDPHTEALQALTVNALPSFTELELSFHAREEASALAGSFVHFLLDAYSRDQFLATWRDAGNGQYAMAFKRHYQQSPDQLSEAWKLYLRSKD